MTQSIRTLAAFALGGLVVAGAALSVHAGPTVAAPIMTTAADPATHTITVSGSGKVTVIPDVARVSFGVTTTKPTVKAARANAAASMTKIIAAIKRLSVDDKDIQTVGLNLYPQYANGSSTRIVGYTISEQLQVTVRDIDNAGDVVDTAMANGANNMNGISFELGDPAKAMNDARAAAVTAARASAQAMATAGHVTLEGVVSIADSSPVTPIYYGAMRGAALDSAATPIQVGSQDVSVTVTVVFSIS
jgi:uncharacterized protein YggE